MAIVKATYPGINPSEKTRIQVTDTVLPDANVSVTGDQLIHFLLTMTPTAPRTITLPPASEIVALLAHATVADALEFLVRNFGAAGSTLTVVPNGGLSGSAVLDGGSYKMFILRLDNVAAPPTYTLNDMGTSGAGPGAGGDVVGPLGATDNAMVVFDGPTGKLISETGVPPILSFSDANLNNIIGTNTVAGVGNNNVGFGNAVVASGNRATAVGATATASALDAVALGSVASASAQAAVALGSVASASVQNAVALGSAATASGQNAVALGSNTNAAQAGAIAIGATAQATTGDAAIAIGFASAASATSAVAIGLAANASALNAVALGFAATASSTSATALGRGTDATTTGAIAVGDGAQATTGVANIAVGNAATATGAAPCIAIGSAVANSTNASLQFPTGLTAIAGNNNARWSAADGGTLAPDSSTIRIKTDVVNLESALDLEKLYQLRPVAFHVKETPNAPWKQFGFIAEETASLMPEITGFGYWVNPETNVQETEITPTSVDYGRLCAPIVLALQQQRQEIQDLKKRIAALEK